MKKQLREQMIATLKDLSVEEKQRIEKRLQQHLYQTDLWKNAQSIGITISRGIEWDTRAIIKQAWVEGKSVYVPKCHPKEYKLVFYQITSFDQLETVYYGLLEPKPEETKQGEPDEIDLLIVPGVVFNREGYRIGFGGGYYDRFLVHFPNQTVALISEKQLVDSLPIEQHDIAVQHLITEKGFIC